MCVYIQYIVRNSQETFSSPGGPSITSKHCICYVRQLLNNSSSGLFIKGRNYCVAEVFAGGGFILYRGSSVLIIQKNPAPSTTVKDCISYPTYPIPFVMYAGPSDLSL